MKVMIGIASALTAGLALVGCGDDKAASTTAAATTTTAAAAATTAAPNGQANGQAGGQAGGKFDRDVAIQQLVGGGMPKEQATCIVDGIMREFGDKVNEATSMQSVNNVLTQEEIKKVGELTAECVQPSGN